MTMAGVTGLSLLLLVAVVGRVSLAYTTTGRTRDWYYDTTTRGWTSRWPYGSTTVASSRAAYGRTSGTTWDWRYLTSTNRHCGTTYSSGLSGYITSPNYPSDYFNNAHCEYVISPGTYVYLRVIDLEKCCDHLVISDDQGNNVTGSYYLYGKYFRVVFTSDGSGVRRGFKLYYGPDYSSLPAYLTTDATLTYGYGYTTNAYYQSSTNWWGWSSKAPFGKVMVTCDSRDFKVTVPRDMIQQVFPGSSEYDLTLDNPKCIGQVYYDVVMFRSNILGCGMTREETGSDIVYKNKIVTQSRGYYGSTTMGSIITRFNSKDIALECHLNRDVSIVGHFRPQHEHELVARGSGNFSMHMDFYRDPSLSYRITSYPIYIGLNQDVYVDVGLESDDSDLKISLQNCVAKPSVNPYDYYNQYYLIRDGCPADQTVAFEYTSSQKHVHFRFRTFEFVRNNRDVYIFCYVRVCNGTDYDQRCRRDCFSPHRQGRDVSDDRKDHDLHIFQGPLTFREKRNAEFQVAERTDEKDCSSAGTVPAIVMVIAAVAKVMAAVVMVIRGKRRNRYHTTGVDTEL